MSEPALTEVAAVRQPPGERRRRWFTSPSMDLIVWQDEAGSPLAFQLCYDLTGVERAITWFPGQGFRHSRVDDGESTDGWHKATPILLDDGPGGREHIDRRFREASVNLPQDIVDFVGGKLREPSAWKAP